MSNTIISNRPGFICYYHPFQLPQFNSRYLLITEKRTDEEGNEYDHLIGKKDRDINVLMSQINGCYLRGDIETGNKHYDALVEILDLSRNTEHGNRMADAILERLNFYLDNCQELSSKYILQWLEEKLKR